MGTLKLKNVVVFTGDYSGFFSSLGVKRQIFGDVFIGIAKREDKVNCTDDEFVRRRKTSTWYL
jgi:RNA-binding protein YlmH